MKTTKEKIEVMQAFERGEKIEVMSKGRDNWHALQSETPEWNWEWCDYRIASTLPTIEGFELVPEDSEEHAQVGWKTCINGHVANVIALHDLTCKEHTSKWNRRFYRPIRQIKMPDGVFWVKTLSKESKLVSGVSSNAISFDACNSWYSLDTCGLENWHWSHDRKTWFNFYGEKV